MNEQAYRHPHNAGNCYYWLDTHFDSDASPARIARAIRKQLVHSRAPAFFEKSLTCSNHSLQESVHTGTLHHTTEKGTLVVNGLHRFVEPSTYEQVRLLTLRFEDWTYPTLRILGIPDACKCIKKGIIRERWLYFLSTPSVMRMVSGVNRILVLHQSSCPFFLNKLRDWWR